VFGSIGYTATVNAKTDAGSSAQAGTIFLDDFENITISDYPSANGWTEMYSGNSASVSDEQSHGGAKSFKLDGADYWARVDYIEIQPSDNLTYETYIYPTPGSTSIIGFAANRGSMCPTYNRIVFWNNGDLNFSADGSNETIIQTYTYSTWYKITVHLDYAALKGDVFIDGVLVKDKLEIQPKEFIDPAYGHTVLNNFSLMVGGCGYASIAYFDDVKLSTTKTNPNEPVPDIISVNYPNPIDLGDTATITVDGKNDGIAAKEGDLQISFPSITDKSKVTDTSDISVATVGKGDIIWANYGKSHISALYVLVDAYKLPWSNGEQHYLAVTVTPTATGNFQFLVKLNMQNSSNQWISDPSSGMVDQQNEFVYSYNISVKSKIPELSVPVIIIIVNGVTMLAIVVSLRKKKK
jgi:hypothetical protein